MKASAWALLWLMGVALTVLCGGLANAEGERIGRYVISPGATASVSGGLVLRGTAGEPAVGTAASGDFLIRHGFQPLVPGIPSAIGPSKDVPRLSLDLAQNRPNPFSATTTIRFSIPYDGDVGLCVFDVAGRRVRSLVDGRRAANVYRVEWDGKNDRGEMVASGVYFYRVKTGAGVVTKRMVLIR